MKRGKVTDNLNSTIAGPCFLGGFFLGEIFYTFIPGPAQTHHSPESCSGANSVGLMCQADCKLASLTHDTGGYSPDSVASWLPVMGNDQCLGCSRDRPKHPTCGILMSPMSRPNTPTLHEAVRLLRRNGKTVQPTFWCYLAMVSPRRRWATH